MTSDSSHPGRIVMRPLWRELLFLHWRVPSESIQTLLPHGLEVETFDGSAWIGLVPFRMENVRPYFVPNLGRVGRVYDAFPELNVRTYVRFNGVSGVWFFSLDCASVFATAAARAWFSLPYFKARMRLNPLRGGGYSYTSFRLFPPPKPATCFVKYEPFGPIAPSPAGSLEEFLVERYILYSAKGNRLYSGRVVHKPYQIQSVHLLNWRENCIKAAGIARPSSQPHAVFSPGVDVDILPLERVR